MLRKETPPNSFLSSRNRVNTLPHFFAEHLASFHGTPGFRGTHFKKRWSNRILPLYEDHPNIYYVDLVSDIIAISLALRKTTLLREQEEFPESPAGIHE